MRWTTSPRLSLELALIRATIPETDAAPEALVSRLERLERVAGITGGGGGSGAAVSGSYSPPPSSAAPAATGGGSQSPATATPAPPTAATPATTDAVGTGEPGGGGTGEAADSAPPAEATRGKRPTKRTAASSAEEAASGPPPPGTAPEPAVGSVLGAGTSAVDVTMLRSNWPTVISHLRSSGKAVLPSFLEIATPAAFDGTTLELVFPPERPYGVQKVIEREGELRQALQDLFGIAPAISCVIREPVAGPAEPVEDEPLSEEEALARLAAELGATPATEDGS
jgi:DNA polymerase III subunit gamma/tau